MPSTALNSRRRSSVRLSPAAVRRLDDPILARSARVILETRNQYGQFGKRSTRMAALSRKPAA